MIFKFNYTNSIDSLYRWHHVTSTYLADYFYSQNGTYASLVNSGDINIIDDFELRKALSDHYNVRLKVLERTDQVVRNLSDDIISPYMLENIEFSSARDGIVSAAPLRAVKTQNIVGSNFNLLSRRQQMYRKLLRESNSLKTNIEQSLEE